MCKFSSCVVPFTFNSTSRIMVFAMDNDEVTIVLNWADIKFSTIELTDVVSESMRTLKKLSMFSKNRLAHGTLLCMTDANKNVQSGSGVSRSICGCISLKMT